MPSIAWSPDICELFCCKLHTSHKTALINSIMQACRGFLKRHSTSVKDKSIPMPCADREYLGLTQQEFDRSPLYIAFEVLVAAVLCFWGKFLSILFFPICNASLPEKMVKDIMKDISRYKASNVIIDVYASPLSNRIFYYSFKRPHTSIMVVKLHGNFPSSSIPTCNLLFTSQMTLCPSERVTSSFTQSICLRI